MQHPTIKAYTVCLAFEFYMVYNTSIFILIEVNSVQQKQSSMDILWLSSLTTHRKRGINLFSNISEGYLLPSLNPQKI